MQISSLLNSLNFILPLLWLAAILACLLKTGKVKIKWVKCGILAALILFAVTAAYSSLATYSVWKQDPVSRYFLPPHNSTYFYQYAYFHFWRPGVINFLAGVTWAVFLFALYKYSSGRILDKSEVALGFFAAFVVGWPKIFAYLAVVFFLMALKGIANKFIFGDKSPVMAASSLVLGALITAGFSDFFMQIPFLENLKL